MSLPLSPLVYRAIALLLFRPRLQLHFLPNCDIFPLQFIKEHCLNDGDRVSTLFMRWRLFKLYGVITEQNTCVARVEAKECPAPAAAASEFGPESVAPFPAFWTPIEVLVRFSNFPASTVYKLLSRANMPPETAGQADRQAGSQAGSRAAFEAITINESRYASTMKAGRRRASASAGMGRSR